ncbi:hypothetical protein P3102_07620 [Amycolatopsis sp. QT-25]|uniref:hypothetical protein n=1 Tax=Amycolatopsis sp. QT-25 TaxID=3034022 RepID=UPI0023ED0358|nr:hypothetical protein [Amycolatopsis sp. QT-25]WET81085.1 hypothetical protein P3102_07620 [Amycolatopsis sp. QT-25]
MNDAKPAQAVRDELTAGLVLVRALLAGDIPAQEAWPAISDFHAAVIEPLLDGSSTLTDQEIANLLSWVRADAGAENLDELVCTTVPDSVQVSEDLLLELLDLTYRVRDASETFAIPMSTDGPGLLVEEPCGRCVLLTARNEADGDWRTELAGVAEIVASALRGTLSQFPSVWRTTSTADPGQPVSVQWPSGVRFTARFATLPIVLWHLQRITKLDSPVPLSMGEVTDGRCAPVDEDAQATRKTAAATAGRELLVPTTSGWRLFAPNGEKKHVQAPLTVDGAATVIWGDEWARWKRERHADELAEMGWRIVDWRQVPEHQPIADLDTSQSFRLTRHFIDSTGISVAVLGGTAQSGKSTVVRRLAAALTDRKRNPWLVLVLAGPTQELPDRHIAATAASHAFGAVEHQAERRLLVFEDLHPTGDHKANEVLRHVSEELAVPVLGVLLYGGNSSVEWSVNGLFVVTSVVGQQARKQFVADLEKADPMLNAGRARSALAEGRSGDLRRLTQMMATQEDPGEQLKRRFAEWAESEREPLVTAAAVSVIGGDVDEERLEQIEEPDRALLGIATGSRPSTVSIAGLDDCLTLIDLHRESQEPNPSNTAQSPVKARNETIVDLVEPELIDALGSGSGHAAGLLIGARLFHRAVCETLIERAEAAGLLTAWVTAAPVSSVVRVLGLADLLPEPVTQTLVNQLIDRLPSGPVDWHPAMLLGLVRTMEDLEFALLPDNRDEFVRWLVNAVDHLVGDQVGSPEERFALLVALERLDSDEVRALLGDRLLDVLAGLRIDQVSGYRLVHQVEEMQRQLEQRAPHDIEIYPVDQEHPVQELLVHEPEDHDGVGVLIGSMSLRQQFEKVDWEVRLQPYEKPLTAAMRFATAAGLADAINHLRMSSPSFCTWLLGHWTDFAVRARTLLGRSNPTEAAMLLKAVARSSSITATSILHRSTDMPDYELVRSFAKRVKDVDDATGAGWLLSTTHTIGDMFDSGSGGFATELAEEIGHQKVKEMILQDPRTSTRYHLIKGVWDAEANYREDVLDLVLGIVVNSVGRNYKHWGAEIALRLGTDADLGALAIEELSRLVASPLLVRNMFQANTAHGRVLFHRLGRVLHADVPTLYRDQWELNTFVEGLSTSTPAAALAVCAEVAKTLTIADVPEAGTMIFQTSGGADVWARRLAFGRRPASFAQAIANLAYLDRPGAIEVVERLRAKKSTVTVGGSSVDTLVAWLRKAMLRDSVVASKVIRAIDDVKPGLGSDLLSEVAQDKHTIYVFRGDIQQVQDPVTQSAAARDLARGGMTRGTANAGWIDTVYTARIQTIDRFASPRSVVALLRMMSTWDRDWGVEAAKQINLARVGRRIRRGRVADLPDAVQLVRALCALDRQASAQRLVGELISSDLAGVGLDTLCQLIDVLEVLKHDAVPRTLRAMHLAIDAVVKRPVVLDERKTWLQVGRALRVKRNMEGGIFGLISEPVIRPNDAYAPVVAWVAGELEMPGWGDDALQRMHAKLRQREYSGSVDQACLLMATAHGQAPELRKPTINWKLERAPFWLLRLLYQQALFDPYLVAPLAAAKPVIYERISHATARADWEAHRLRLVFSASGPTEGTQPTGSA